MGQDGVWTGCPNKVSALVTHDCDSLLVLYYYYVALASFDGDLDHVECSTCFTVSRKLSKIQSAVISSS